MSAQPNDGGSIAPTQTHERVNDTFVITPTDGFSLRDYFASAALPNVILGIQKGLIGEHELAGGGPRGFAATSYEIADAMLAARETKPRNINTELLEALEAFVAADEKAVRLLGEGYEPPLEYVALHGKARTAIAKAKGEEAA